MNRLALALPVVATGLGAVLSSACSFHSPIVPDCLVVDGSATVSSPTGTFGPPDFAHVNRDYTLTSDCGRGSNDHRDHNLTADAHYNPITRSAVEEIVGEVYDQPFDLASSWTCPDDPWVVPDMQCTLVSFDQRQGEVPGGLETSVSQPQTSAFMDLNGHRDVAARLLADFINKMKSHPSSCAPEFGSVVVAPTANQRFVNNAPVTLNVQRGSGCSPTVDGIQPVFELEWQHRDPNTGQFSDVNIVPTFDGTANPNGASVPQSLFVPFEGGIGTNVWRVRAKLLNTPTDAPWSDFVQFTTAG